MIVGNIVPNYVWINQLISSRLFMTNIVKSLKEMKLWLILSCLLRKKQDKINHIIPINRHFIQEKLV